MKPDQALRIILGRELFREAQQLAAGRESVADLVREALRRFLPSAPCDEPRGCEDAASRPRSREGPPPRGPWPLRLPRSDFNLQGCTFILGDPSPSQLRILDAGDGEIVIPISIAVAFLLHLHRAFGVALLERALSPEDFVFTERGE